MKLLILLTLFSFIVLIILTVYCAIVKLKNERKALKKLEEIVKLIEETNNKLLKKRT